LLVAYGRLVQRYADGKIETLHELEAGGVAVVVSDPRGGVLFQRREGTRGDIFSLAGRERTHIQANATLEDAAVIDGVPSVLYTTCIRRPQREPEGYVYVMELEGQTSRRIADACRPEFFVMRVSFGGDVVVLSASSDLTEAFEFYALDGRELTERPDPTKDLPYNEPPLLIQAVLSPDGTSLAYLEGPDVSGIAGGGDVRVGDWALVVQDQRSGRETLRLDLARPADERGFARLDFDGRWAALSQSGNRPVRVVDTKDARPREIKLRDVRGVASFEERAKA
jgi:hypothetical protein